ncbi:MAG: Mth938-like domain-containing protein [Steroidobacteraceae bacterium]
MRLVLDSDPRINLIRSYDEAGIVVGAQRLTRPCLITPQRLLSDWGARSLALLSASDLEPLWPLGGEIVLLGSAETALPSAAVRAAFRDRRIALECMGLGAACRTYNILAGEARRVVAGLFP